jgi:hypothetical protein
MQEHVVHAPVRGCRGEAWMEAPGSWDTGEVGGIVRCKLELQRSEDLILKKSQIQLRNTVEKAIGEEETVATFWRVGINRQIQ